MGRPRAFDQDKVLDAASQVFWSKGYEATSTRELSEATGLTAASIYNAFTDKRGLFLSAMDHYLNATIRDRIARHEALPSAGDALIGFFAESVVRALSDPLNRGCMLVNTALEATPDDPEMTRFVAEEMHQIEGFFLRVISAGQKSGEFPGEQKAEDLAAHFLALLMGLRVLSRVRPEAKLFNSLLKPAFAQLGLKWTARKASPSPRS
jgi:TetR/AcrR family transcriptional repressor of nem operon